MKPRMPLCGASIVRGGHCKAGADVQGLGVVQVPVLLKNHETRISH